MRPVPALVLVALVSLVAAQDTTTDAFNDGLNSVEPKPSVRLDPYIRKALLKALSELEESDAQITGADTTDGTSTVDAEILKTSESDTETLQTQTAKDGIQIHSFIVNGQSAFENSTDSTPAFVDSKISILSTTAGNVENQVTATLPTQTPFNEIFQTRESGINVQQVRSIATPPKSSNDNTIISTSARPKPTKSTTTTTTTTTTPRPTHNDDGENIEEVEKDGVQVFQAPLVAAFTVQQDAHGLPKKVIPLFQQTFTQNVAKPPSPENIPSRIMQLPILTQSLTLPKVDKPPQSDFISQQLALQRQLEEKQRILEEQLRLLQAQQRQQEELLRKQQFLLHQKEAQRQQQIQFEQEQFKRQQFQNNQTPNNSQQQIQFEQEQFKRQQFQYNQTPNNFHVQDLQKNFQVNQFLNQNNIRPQASQVSIQQSVPLVQGANLANHQQLPSREAVDFLIHLRTQQPEQFPLQENHLPQGISTFLQPNPIQNFNQLPNFNQIRPTEDQFRQKQANRVFRQESGVGNFGVNNQNYNRFNTFGPLYTNRFFPSNRFNQYNPDADLKQLLVQNGLNGRNQEDLNIVSKVLSLNHGVVLNNNISNRLPFDSRRHVRPPL